MNSKKNIQEMTVTKEKKGNNDQLSIEQLRNVARKKNEEKGEVVNFVYNFFYGIMNFLN